jgi:hypothetical protein
MFRALAAPIEISLPLTVSPEECNVSTIPTYKRALPNSENKGDVMKLITPPSSLRATRL